MSRYIFLLFLFYSVSNINAQTIDSTQTIDLKDVVVTGQVEPQSLKKSVHNVRVITNQDIKNLAANNLGDVLNQYLNITVRPSSNSGRSTVSMFGLDAQYFKILVDNIPLVNEAGFGNNVDLSQINLNDIERIEIIEGSMGVTHGANAVSGILNIITKKSNTNKWAISTTLQEETIGDEYEWFDKGRHIQNLKVAHNISDKWFASLGANRSDFQGFLGNQKGKNHAVNNGLRGYRWLPKEQWNASALLHYKKKIFQAFYKFEYLNEQIDYYNNVVQSGFSNQLGAYKYGDDIRYFTNRFYHHLNVVGKLFSKINYNISLSHQLQERLFEEFRYTISNQTESNNNKFKDQSTKVVYSTGNFSNFFKHRKVDFQLGYEMALNNGFSLLVGENNSTKTICERIDNYDVFAVAEIKLTDNFSIRPGARYSFQSKFDNQYALSLGARQLFKNDFEIRASVGKSFRTPSFEELFTELIFSGHYFVGNENLIPERSTSYEASIKKRFYIGSDAAVATNLIASFMDIKDRIDMALIGFDETNNNPMYQYININKYNMWNVSTNNQLEYNQWRFNLGASLVGISRFIDNGEFQSDDKYLYSFNLNSSVSYNIQKWNTIASIYYKFTGKTQQFVEDQQGYALSDIESYNWLDASIQKNFFKDKLELTMGARNLFNITDINQTNLNQGGGHSVSSQILLAYGTSYFTKLTYNLNF